MISSAKINKNKSNNSSCFSSCSWEIIVDMAVSLEPRIADNKRKTGSKLATSEFIMYSNDKLLINFLMINKFPVKSVVDNSIRTPRT